MEVGRDGDDETLALQLKGSAGLKDELRQLLITSIGEERDHIVDQTKRAMRRYLGGERAGISAKGDREIKEEAFESENRESLYSRNNSYKLIGSRSSMRGRFRGGRFFRGQEVQQEEYISDHMEEEQQEKMKL